MRIALNLNVLGKENVLPINYQYELASWLYKTIHFANPGFSDWLHQNGYSYENKRFKHFTFSNLNIPQRKVQSDRIVLLNGKARLLVSFSVNKSLQTFIYGMFQKQAFTLGDKKSQVQFEIRQVESLPEPLFKPEKKYTFQALSPICVSVQGDDNAHAQYLSPDDPRFEQGLSSNLRNKFASLFGTENLNGDSLKMRLHGVQGPKSRLVKIKADTTQQSFIRGYTFRFTLEGSARLIRMAYNAGIGEKNSLGFGCIEEVGA